MRSLYSITEEMQSWIDKVEDNDGVVTDELLLELDGIEGSFEDKAEAYAAVIKTYEAEEAVLTAEIQRLTARRTSRQNNVKRLRGNLVQAMQLFGLSKHKSPRWTISLRSSVSAQVVDAAQLPEEYWRIERKPAISDISAALKAGQEVKGATLAESHSVQIR